MDKFIVWLKNADQAYPLIFNVGKSIVILFVAFLIVKIGSFLIKRVFNKQRKLKIGISEKKADTAASMFSSILKYAVYIIAVIVILVDIFSVKSILAAAGVVGVGLGLGVQNFIKDVIAGFFIIAEEQYEIGDLVTLDKITGTVEGIELRITKVRGFTGELNTIPNGEIRMTTNHTRGYKVVFVDIPVRYDNDMKQVLSAAEEVCKNITIITPELLDPLSVLGINEMKRGYMNIRITAKCVPNQQWSIERAVRMAIFEKFREESIALAAIEPGDEED